MIHQRSFETFTELHYSQTVAQEVNEGFMFETFTELHYSQTIQGQYTLHI